MVVERREGERVEREQDDVLRHHKPPPPGTRPGVLEDPRPALVPVSRGSQVGESAPLLTRLLEAQPTMTRRRSSSS